MCVEYGVPTRLQLTAKAGGDGLLNVVGMVHCFGLVVYALGLVFKKRCSYSEHRKNNPILVGAFLYYSAYSPYGIIPAEHLPTALTSLYLC